MKGLLFPFLFLFFLLSLLLLLALVLSFESLREGLATLFCCLLFSLSEGIRLRLRFACFSSLLATPSLGFSLSLPLFFFFLGFSN